MNSRAHLIRTSLLLVFAGIAIPARAFNPPIHPNIVFILADDLGYMDIGANNPKSFYETPNIDKLAKSGMRFTQGYAACCVCSPTRGSIMTGKYPARFGITDWIPGSKRPGKLVSAPNAVHLPLEEVTLAEALRESGYSTFFAGKWHLGTGKLSPNAQGFGPDLISSDGSQFWYPSSDVPPPSHDDDPKTTDRIVNDAIRFIAANKDKPFFAYLPFLAVHNKIGARRDLVAKYERKKGLAPEDASGVEGDRKVNLVQNNAVYAAMIEQLDSGIGRLQNALSENGLTEKTVVIFMSDNGGLSTSEGSPTSNLPLRGGKGWPYEGGIREPWIISAPGVTNPDTICDSPVISTDYYPTILELAGLPLKPEQHVDGVSIVQLLKAKTLPQRPIFWHYPHYSNQGGAPHGAVRVGEFKLIEWYEDMRAELYNLQDDLEERHDLSNKLAEKTDELRMLLHDWRADLKAQMPTPNADFKPKAPASEKNNTK